MKKYELNNLQASNRSNGIINGDCSGILDWDDTRYDWVYPTYKQQLKNHWQPFEVKNFIVDRRCWDSQMNDLEKDTFKLIIGSLASLDSPQSVQVRRWSDFITDSAVQAVLIMIAKEEVIHNHSYSYVLSELVDQKEQRRVFDTYKSEELLRTRNDLIFDAYEAFNADPNTGNMLKSLVADIVLEGIDFYSAFAFFYNLSRNGKMNKTVTMINWINRDEAVHVGTFARIFRAILAENPQYNTPELMEWATACLRKAGELEIEWANKIIGDRFEDIDVNGELAGYVRFICNKRATELGVPKPFDRADTNPMAWIKVYEDMDFKKVDYFEDEVTSYTDAMDDFDDLE